MDLSLSMFALPPVLGTKSKPQPDFSTITNTGSQHHKVTFFAAGLDLLHVNCATKTITKELSLLGRPHISFGSRLHPKNKRYYIFGAIAYNVYHSGAERKIPLTFSETSGNKPFQHWPGFAAGILIQ